jgi:two-component system, NarL family, sensor kinase
MNLLQITNAGSSVPTVLFFGTIGMLSLTIGLIVFIIFHQRKVIRYQLRLQKMEHDQQKMLLNASIRLQEEERQRIAADLHDDAGPLLATARLYLNENLVNLDKTTQLQSIYNAKQIIDDTIQLIRNISHSLMPPTLKNFGLESAVNDLFQKISGSGSMNASSRFHDYRERLQAENELIIFRVIQELVNNILKHSNASFIHLTQNTSGDRFFIRLHHDGRGITQTDFEKLNKSNVGLGLKNIQSRLKVLHGKIFFEKDMSQTYYKVTIELVKDEEHKLTKGD